MSASVGVIGRPPWTSDDMVPYGRAPNSAVREASRAGACPAGRSVSRNATSAVVSAGTQVFSVGWHVAAALDHLADELILRELYSDSIQTWATLSAGAAQRMAVVALLRLKNECPLPLQGRAPFQVLRWNGFAAPRIHHRTPRRITGQMSEGTECHRH